MTVIGLSLSTLTFIVALLADVTLSRRLFLTKNLLLVCSAPLEVLISVLYWGLRVVSGVENRFALLDQSNRVCPSVQIDERLVLPDWAVIPLHAGALTNLTAADTENSGERALTLECRSRFPCGPIYRDVGGSAVAVSSVDNLCPSFTGLVQCHCLRVLVLG